MHKLIENMEGHTELEKKLFDYILFLIGLQNVYEVSFHHLCEYFSESSKWTNKNWEIMERNTKYLEMMSDLNNIFNWNLELTPFETNKEDKN